MGRIKSTLVKRTAHELINRMDNFDDKFNTNKKILGNTMPSKKVRNKIAGYVARLKKRSKKSATTIA